MASKKRKATAKATPPKQSSKTTSNQQPTKTPAPANCLANVPDSRPVRQVLRDPQKPRPIHLLPRPPAV